MGLGLCRRPQHPLAPDKSVPLGLMLGRCVSAAHADLVHFAESIDSSRKALLTIGKIHQTMCGRNQIAKVTPADQGSTPLSSVEQLTGPRTVADCEKAGMKWDGNTAACIKGN